MIVFVHGVPETAAIWRKVRERIDRDSVAVELPGFGCPRPDGFAATKDAYAGWLADELSAIGEPVDLVGHDWGAGLTYRIATAHGGLLRSWVADVGNIAHPDYTWHDVAQMWQTPEVGEQVIEAMVAPPLDERATAWQGMGISADDAREMAGGVDQAMGGCILDLYRSATPNPHADWGPWEPTSAPGMVVHSAGDTFSDATLAREVADQLGARFEVLDAPGHFWPYDAPDAGAALLTTFWDSLE